MQRTRKDVANPERGKTYHGTKRCKTFNVCEWRETCNEWQRRGKHALGTKRKNTCNLSNSVASVEGSIVFSAKHRKSCNPSYSGKPGMKREMWNQTRLRKNLLLMTVGNSSSERTLWMLTREDILGPFMWRKIRRILHKMQTLPYKRHISFEIRRALLQTKCAGYTVQFASYLGRVLFFLV